MSEQYKYVLTDAAIAPNVGLVQINRPEKYNAINVDVMGEIAEALTEMDANAAIHCIVLAGNAKAFAAGADIKAMSESSAIDMFKSEMTGYWTKIRAVKKPIVAAVSGFALGAGCELIMTCDMVIASETAKFGQPEIKIGIMPGAGGTQRLTKAVGKAKAMELALTGRFLSAKEAMHYHLINKIVPVELYLKEAVKLASEIAQKSPISAQLIKESINQSFNTSLDEGLLFERRNFFLTFASQDQKEGMAAFLEKRKADFKGE